MMVTENTDWNEIIQHLATYNLDMDSTSSKCQLCAVPGGKMLMLAAPRGSSSRWRPASPSPSTSPRNLVTITSPSAAPHSASHLTKWSLWYRDSRGPERASRS